MAGIKGLKYAGDLGLLTKPTDLLANNLEIKLTSDQSELISYNINAFKQIINRYEEKEVDLLF